MAANLSVTLKLIDQMSQKLESIASGGDRVANNFNQLGRQADDAFNKNNYDNHEDNYHLYSIDAFDKRFCWGFQRGF